MKKLLTIPTLLLILSSCGSDPIIEVEEETQIDITQIELSLDPSLFENTAEGFLEYKDAAGKEVISKRDQLIQERDEQLLEYDAWYESEFLKLDENAKREVLERQIGALESELRRKQQRIFSEYEKKIYDLERSQDQNVQQKFGELQDQEQAIIDQKYQEVIEKIEE